MSPGLNVSEPAVAHTRAEIYYWKSDRASSLHNLGVANEGMAGEKLSQLQSFLRQTFPDFHRLKPVGGKGNHFTYFLEEGGRRHFVRVDGVHVLAAARHHSSIEAGILIRDRMAAVPLLERGFRQIAVDSDLAILRTGFLTAARIRTPSR